MDIIKKVIQTVFFYFSTKDYVFYILSQTSAMKYRKFKNFDTMKFRQDIAIQNWASVNAFENPNVIWSIWKNIFNSVVDKHAPLRSKQIKASKSPWISAYLKDEMHTRDIQKIKAIRSNDPQDWLLFRKLRNSVNQKIIQAKEAYFKNTFV